MLNRRPSQVVAGSSSQITQHEKRDTNLEIVSKLGMGLARKVREVY